MSRFIVAVLKRSRVVAGNLLPYLLLLQTGLTMLASSGEIDKYLPEEAQYVGIAITAVGFAITFIRRVTPVPKDQRGVLPQSPD